MTKRKAKNELQQKNWNISVVAIQVALWLALALTLFASVTHVAWAFGTLEPAGQEWVGWLAAVAIDTGMAVLVYAQTQKWQNDAGKARLRAGIVAFTIISAVANLLHAMNVQVGAVVLSTFWSVDLIEEVKAVLFAVSLPCLVWFLSNVSTDNLDNVTNLLGQKKDSVDTDEDIVDIDKDRPMSEMSERWPNKAAFVHDPDLSLSVTELAAMTNQTPRNARRWMDEARKNGRS